MVFSSSGRAGPCTNRCKQNERIAGSAMCRFRLRVTKAASTARHSRHRLLQRVPGSQKSQTAAANTKQAFALSPLALRVVDPANNDRPRASLGCSQPATRFVRTAGAAAAGCHGRTHMGTEAAAVPIFRPNWSLGPWLSNTLRVFFSLVFRACCESTAAVAVLLLALTQI